MSRCVNEASDTIAEVVDSLDAIRVSLNGSTCRLERSRIGQFLTPIRIARFMASLFERRVEHARILDAGAGAGVFLAACLEALSSRAHHPAVIEVVAYENDQQILPYLRQTIERCELTCRRMGISFKGEIRTEEFMSSAISRMEHRMFAPPREWFTHAILNPPYMKINAKSDTRRLLDAANMGVSNSYAAFVWLATRMLEPGGELVAITPRSFCNGPYFRRFRLDLLQSMSLRRIHVFESRNKAFEDDNVLQENIIYYAVRGENRPGSVVVSSSIGTEFAQCSGRSVPYERVISPSDRDAFIHLALNDADDCLIQRVQPFCRSLFDLGLDVSTGPVVDFRARNYLRPTLEKGAMPLIYPCHFQSGFVNWPAKSTKKPNAILVSTWTMDTLLPSGYYVLTKRFSAKEEPRRVVAAVYDPDRVGLPFVGFENHLNYFHVKGRGLPSGIAKGLALYLNSSLFDKCFRLFSGHTQVNATDLRKMRYPSREELVRLGMHVRDDMPDQDAVDAILEKECSSGI